MLQILGIVTFIGRPRRIEEKDTPSVDNLYRSTKILALYRLLLPLLHRPCFTPRIMHLLLNCRRRRASQLHSPEYCNSCRPCFTATAQNLNTEYCNICRMLQSVVVSGAASWAACWWACWKAIVIQILEMKRPTTETPPFSTLIIRLCCSRLRPQNLMRMTLVSHEWWIRNLVPIFDLRRPIVKLYSFPSPDGCVASYEHTVSPNLETHIRSSIHCRSTGFWNSWKTQHCVIRPIRMQKWVVHGSDLNHQRLIMILILVLLSGTQFQNAWRHTKYLPWPVI